jgi:hypothetical protein
MEYWHGVRGSVRLRTREFHHLCPLLGFFDDEYSELGRRAAEHRRAQIEIMRYAGPLHPRVRRVFVETVASRLRGKESRRRRGLSSEIGDPASKAADPLLLIGVP